MLWILVKTIKYVALRVGNVGTRVVDNGKRDDHFMAGVVEKGISTKYNTASIMDNGMLADNNATGGVEKVYG